MFWRDALLILWNMKMSVRLTSSSIWSSSSGILNTRSAADDIAVSWAPSFRVVCSENARQQRTREEGICGLADCISAGDKTRL
jgi:hypothetical protein